MNLSSAQQHAQVKQLFIRFIDQPPENVKSELTQEGTDPSVVKQVLELLETYQTHTQQTQEFVKDVAENISNSPFLFPTDRYLLIKKIGQGGMGDVYLAQRKIKGIKHKVAIKILQNLHETSKSRFSQETQILSQLTHKNICQFIDADFLEDGRPYVVMEFAEGDSITNYCRNTKATIHSKLSLFKELCQAVQHAHQNLIIHRDIKPDNILVDQQGQIKLLDFGIAKILEKNPSEKTKTKLQSMTPAYASPEQFLNKPITVASDVYSLGILLYELLTENRPFALADYSHSEYENILKNTHPIAPSEKLIQSKVNATAKQEARAIKGDLDQIILKSLQFEVKERYQTVAELLHDIERFENNRPVLAQAPKVSYRTKKFLIRNKKPVALVSFLFLLTVFFVSLLINKNKEIQSKSIELLSQRDQARRELQRAETLSDIFVQAFKMADLTITEGKEITAKEILLQSVHLIKEYDLSDIKLKAKLIIAISEVNRNIGESKESLELLQSISQEMKKPELNNSKLRIKYLYELAMSLSANDRVSDAISLLTKLNSNDQTIILALGKLYMKAGNDSKALLLLKKLYNSTNINNPLFPEVCSSYASIKTFGGEKKGVEEILNNCIKQLELKNSQRSRIILIKLLYNLGDYYMFTGNYQMALDNYLIVLNYNIGVFGESHIKVSTSYGSLANIYKKMGDTVTSLKYYNKLLDAYTKYYGEKNVKNAYPNFNIGSFYFALNMLEKAEFHYLKAIKYFDDNGKSTHKNISFFLFELSNLYIQQKEYKKATRTLERCSTIFNSDSFTNKYRYIDAQILLSYTYLKLGNTNKAQEIFNSSYPFVLENFKPEEEPADKETWDMAEELFNTFNNTVPKS